MRQRSAEETCVDYSISILHAGYREEYCARLYRSLSCDNFGAVGVICVCLDQPVFIKVSNTTKWVHGRGERMGYSYQPWLSNFDIIIIAHT